VLCSSYERIVERFIEFLGAKAGARDLSTLQAVEITRFRDREAKALSLATANLSLIVLRVCFGEAVRNSLALWLCGIEHREQTNQIIRAAIATAARNKIADKRSAQF
jgi:hypothetical protein